jgi:hypothetical protein
MLTLRRSSIPAVVIFSLYCIVQAQTPKPSISDLAWLSGCWESNRNGREINEQWMKPSGQTMLGMGRTVSKGKTVEYEFVQIREGGDGSIYYVAKPSGQSEASFKLIKYQNREATFENPEHDFPQRVIYRLEPDGSWFARVEGTSNGKARGFDYPMKRGQCN